MFGIARRSPVSRRTGFLTAVWVLFFVLVGLGIHGSSLTLTNGFWSPQTPSSGYVFSSLAAWMKKVNAPPAIERLAMSTPRPVRSDEWLVNTPVALSQFSHNPRFPVVNTNIGTGQNMLVWSQYNVPVWHITALARPSTWGFLFLGRLRGLAWLWWFQSFACFTALYLLLELLLKGHKKLAAFGAFWFCCSSYVVCWSLCPAYAAFFPAFGCVCTYRIFSSSKTWVLISCGIFLGLSFPGFMMIMYPPWQVPLGYLFLFILAGLFVRDRLYLALRRSPGRIVAALVLAVLVGGALTAAFLLACRPDLRVIADTIYPGQRTSLGGDYPPWRFFRGLYNVLTIDAAPPALWESPTAAASFYYLFPAVLAAVCLSKRFAVRLGAVGWALVCYIVALLYFINFGIPAGLAGVTLMSYVRSLRADVGIGLASTILCVYAHGLAPAAQRTPERKEYEKMMPLAASILTLLLFGWTGIALRQNAVDFPPLAALVAAPVLAACASYFMLTRWSKLFYGLVGLSVLAAGFFFNPLSRNIDYVYDSELAQTITRLNEQSDKPPLWICYGNGYPGTLVILLGGRSISGIQWPPQMSLWHSLDPDRTYEPLYNNYVHVILSYGSDPEQVSFSNPQLAVLDVSVSPDHPVLRSMGARYVLAMGTEQGKVATGAYPLIYRSAAGDFSVFEIAGPPGG